MEPWKRVALLGLLVGLVYTALRILVIDSVTASAPDSRNTLILQSLAVTVASLAVLPGLALYGGWRADVEGARSLPMLAAVVATGTGVAVVVSYPAVTTVSVGAPLSETLQGWLVGTYLVNAVGPSVNAGVAALAGLLLAEHSA